VIVAQVKFLAVITPNFTATWSFSSEFYLFIYFFFRVFEVQKNSINTILTK